MDASTKYGNTEMHEGNYTIELQIRIRQINFSFPSAGAYYHSGQVICARRVKSVWFAW